MMLAVRIAGMAYLTAGCIWTRRFTAAWVAGQWHMTMRGLREQGIPSALAYPMCFVFWLYDGLVEIMFWPWGVRRELRFRRWLRANVPPASPVHYVVEARDLAHLASHPRRTDVESSTRGDL